MIYLSNRYVIAIDISVFTWMTLFSFQVGTEMSMVRAITGMIKI
jgi:hypothetical protein